MLKKLFTHPLITLTISLALLLHFSCDVSESGNSDADTQKPTITLLGDNPQLISFGGTYKEAGAVATDNVDDTDELSANIKISGVDDIDLQKPGNYSVMYNVTDDAGNDADEVSRTVRVADENEDVVKPVISISGNNPDTITKGDTWSEPNVTAEDDVDGNLTNSITKEGSVNTNSVGKYSIIYSVSDNSDNIAKDTLIVVVIEENIEDNTAPVITIDGDNPDTISVGSNWSEPNVSAVDNVDGNITQSIKKTGSVDANKIGKYEITYSVSDEAGNSSSKKLVVVVVEGAIVDTKAPVITISGNNPDTITQGESWSYPDVSAQDDVDGDISSEILKSGNVDSGTLGKYEITYTVSDAAGNSATKKLTVVVVLPTDTEAPVITIGGDNPLIINTGNAFNEPDVTATDNYDGDVTSDITKAGSVDSGTEGTYNVIYTVSDAAGNSVSDTLVVVVVFAYPVHTNIKASTFWCGEGASSSNDFITNTLSAWDSKWGEHFGLEDHPTEISRDSDFIPTSSQYSGDENPYYCALPYNDYGDLIYDGEGPTIDGHPIDSYYRKSDCYDNIHWGNDKSPAGWGNGYSLCKNRWIKVRVSGTDKTCYAQWEDSGPYYYNDHKYVFGSSKPANTTDAPYAGIDLSPSVCLYLGREMKEWGTPDFGVDWEFVDEDAVPDGPWKKHVTTRQVSW